MIPILRIISRLFIFSSGYNSQRLCAGKYPDVSNIMKINLIEKNNKGNNDRIKIKYMISIIIDFFYNSKNINKYINYNRALLKDKIINYDSNQKNKFLNDDEICLYIRLYKHCLLFYYDSYKIEYNDIIELKKIIINNIQNNNYIKNTQYSKDNNENNKLFQINKLYSESERALFIKIFKGYFYNYSLLDSIFADDNSSENIINNKGTSTDNNFILNKLYRAYKEECFFF